MALLKKIGSILLKTFLAFLSLALLYLIIAIIFTLIPVNSHFRNDSPDIIIWVSSNGVHTNMILPVSSGPNDWREFLPLDRQCNYLVIGWGDQEFYMNTPEWSDLKFGTALKAIFVPTKTVMQAFCTASEPKISKRTKKLNITENQYDLLVDYILQSFETDSLGKLIELIPEKGPGSIYKYYRARGKYSLFFTCNNWTGRGLKQAGIKNSLWAPFDRSVLFYLK